MIQQTLAPEVTESQAGVPSGVPANCHVKLHCWRAPPELVPVVTTLIPSSYSAASLEMRVDRSPKAALLGATLPVQ